MAATAAAAEEEASAAQEAAAVQLASAALLEDLERQYVQVQAEKDHLQGQLAAAIEQLAQVRAANDGLRGASDAVLELAKVRQRCALLTTEKQNLGERLDRMQAESDRLREEIRYSILYVYIDNFD
jgi:hypothetical protein